MLSKSNLPLAVLTALALMVAASGASAEEFDVTLEPAGAIESPSVGRITLGEGGFQLACNFTLSGALLEGPIAALPGEQFGSITEVTIANCSGGEFEGVLDLPWELTIENVLGTLPNEVEALHYNIEGFQINLATFFGVVNCLWGEPDEAAANIVVTNEGGGEGVYTVGETIPDTLRLLTFNRGSGLCPETISFAGEYDLDPSQTITIS